MWEWEPVIHTEAIEATYVPFDKPGLKGPIRLMIVVYVTDLGVMMRVPVGMN